MKAIAQRFLNFEAQRRSGLPWTDCLYILTFYFPALAHPLLLAFPDLSYLFVIQLKIKNSTLKTTLPHSTRQQRPIIFSPFSIQKSTFYILFLLPSNRQTISPSNRFLLTYLRSQQHKITISQPNDSN